VIVLGEGNEAVKKQPHTEKDTPLTYHLKGIAPQSNLCAIAKPLHICGLDISIQP
jgi:hypothetical protein